MRDLGAIQQYVWEFLDLEPEDMPEGLITAWAAEGYRRCVRVARRWPHFQARFQVAQPAGEATIAAPIISEVRPAVTTEVEHVDPEDPEAPPTVETVVLEPAVEAEMEEPLAVEVNGRRLRPLDEMEAQNFFTRTAASLVGEPQAWSRFAGEIVLWPAPVVDTTVTIRGFRRPFEWWVDGGGVPDFPADFEDALLSWVMHKAYTHQDDTELAVFEKDRFEQQLNEMARYHQAAGGEAPMILGHGAGRHRPGTRPDRLPYFFR